ncbi:mucosa-associated lymphoid tissue lymphoma translocation protein 1 [Strongylocentrotus purpuratus]|uniref:Uncharacterized protein n=1 Tax=Strongylocentrotus purpuratus TaxID=7668 RepID=A0A7M7SUM1_STRPU|nr:mucosa-associated lymphoid tissue lymphoma translocation protein 1 [Strongylocentrotus purpuratus]XP_030832618.1 mucosa-associated lymphoid tissue lymphoma translocation protein 1 [Strongylocentrotus purpuratus]
MHANIDPETVITKLPFKVMDELSGLLDIPDGSGRPYWKALIAVLPGDMYTDIQINRFSMEGLSLRGGGSSYSLLRDLGQRYCKTVKQLAAYLDRLHYEAALLLIKATEPLSIADNPNSCSVMTGELVKFSCKGKGFPYPRYQWYRAHTKGTEGGEIVYDEVSGAVDSVLEIESADDSHAGGYCCKVYHIPNGQQCSKFTEWAYLTVIRGHTAPPSTSPSGQILAPPVIRQQPEGNLRVDQGRELVLTCRATGCPKPDYQWYKYEDNPKTGAIDKEHIKGCTSEVLQFAQATSLDAGQYICHVYNSVAEAWSTTSNVTITTLAESLKRTQRCNIEILRDPIDVQCLPSVDQKLECLASCSTAKLFFQWYKDGQPIEGETTNQLCFQDLKTSDAGKYFCRVTAENIKSEDSKVAELKFLTPEEKFTATDKVALLIGNEAYRSGTSLSAPGNDMEKMAYNLYRMNFKVVSLLNLTVAEMRKALKIFCSLLSEGVYGLFYFSGHGFEQGGQTYMVPADAPTGYLPEECICAEEVLASMQEKNTALNVLLLDICRKFNDFTQGEFKRFESEAKGNTVYGYAATINSEAFEVSHQGYAIFTKYLVKRIHEECSIYDILKKVINDVNKDPYGSKKQFPSLMGNLKEDRSLADCITYTGRTTEFNTRNDAWQRGHELPSDIPIAQLPYGIVAQIEFEIRFSNVMLIITKILNRGASTWCEATPAKVPPEVDIKLLKGHLEVPDLNGRQGEAPFYKAIIENIQRIRGDFIFDLIVNYEYGGQRYTQALPIRIDRPLISQVWLMDELETERSPTEDEYPDSSTSNSLV